MHWVNLLQELLEHPVIESISVTVSCDEDQHAQSPHHSPLFHPAVLAACCRTLGDWPSRCADGTPAMPW
jgi:IS5 family transposase